MDLKEIPEEKGRWRKERVLGAGGFGYVILWQNKESKETIALKQCRWGNDSVMTPKHRDRWKLEVDIMSRLNHPNVVKALVVPSELNVPATELPLLAMEYCCGGDLRKMLNKSENCCGLPEYHVRLLLRHVSSAVNYLHSVRIIHRDLKPENIVIQEANTSMLFKLIDLGYAKELDQGSLCTSFVGTLQYLAPELFMSQKYSCTVDYWSLGLVTHEVITGIRPFLPDKSPAEWMPIIKNKKASQIRAFLDDDKNIVFSEEISPHHRICSVLKQDIESWLQIMLEYDSKKRGRCQDSSAFVLLEKVLERKILYIYCVSTLKLLSFPLEQFSSIEDLQRALELETGIPVTEQEIILTKGNRPCTENGLPQFLPNSDEDEIGSYLLSTNDNFVSLIPGAEIPILVERMMRNPHTEVKYLEQRTSWAQAVHLSQQELTSVGHLIRAFRVNLMNLLTELSEFHKAMFKMTSEMNKMIAKSSLFQSSLELDLVSYETQAETGGFSSQSMFEGWQKCYGNLKNIELLKRKVATLEEHSSSIHAQTVDLQKTPYARSKITNPLDEVLNKILEAFGELKKRTKDQRHLSHDNTDIVRLLCQCLQLSRSSVQDIAILIRQANKLRKAMRELAPQTVAILQEIRSWDSQICSWQFKRQREMWKVIDALVCKYHGLEYSATPLSLPKSEHSPSTNNFAVQKNNLVSAPENLNDLSLSPQNVSPPVICAPVVRPRIESLTCGSAYLPEMSRAASSIGSSMGGFLSSVLHQTLEDTHRIKQENEELVESFQKVINLLKNDCVEDAPLG